MLAGKKCQLHPRRLQCCELGMPDLQVMSVLSQISQMWILLQA